MRSRARVLRASCAPAIAAAALACVSVPDGEERVRASIEERAGVAFAAEAEPAPPPPLGEDDLVALALRNNAAFRAALADLGIAEADWLRAGALPPLSFSLLFPLGDKQLEYAAKLPVDALWLRPKRVAAARKDWEATAEALVQHGLDLVRDVRAACADLAAARARQSDLLEAARAQESLAALVGKRFAAGALSGLAASTPRQAAFAARDRANAGDAELRAADARLRELVGDDPRTAERELTVEAPLDARSALPLADELVRDALAARPDLRAAELGLESAGERAGLARREIFQLVAVFDVNGSGPDFEAGPGIELPIPLDGGRAGRTAAGARLRKAAAGYDAAVRRVAREVREAHARAELARSSALARRDARVPELENALRRAERAVANGAADATARYEAQRALAESKAEAASTYAAWRRARAELERAVGRRLELGADSSPTTHSVTP